MNKKYEVAFLEEAYEFLQEIDKDASKKIIYNIEKSQLINDVKLFKKLKNTEIWGFRTLYNKKQYRILAFWDKRDKKEVLVVCTHGFIKKSQKTPPNEIEHAEKLMEAYFNQKK